MTDATPSQFELHYQPIAINGRSFAFPCDPRGRVDLDSLSERARNNYLYARAMVGRELTPPAVQCSTMQ